MTGLLRQALSRLERRSDEIVAREEDRIARHDAERDFARLARRCDDAADAGHPRRLRRYQKEMRQITGQYGAMPQPRADRTNKVISTDLPLVEITLEDHQTGRKTVEFTGEPLAWLRDFMPPKAQAVAQFASYTRTADGSPWPEK